MPGWSDNLEKHLLWPTKRHAILSHHLLKNRNLLVLSKKNGRASKARSLSTGCENKGACLGNGKYVRNKEPLIPTAEHERGSIFSPSFHHSREPGDDLCSQDHSKVRTEPICVIDDTAKSSDVGSISLVRMYDDKMSVEEETEVNSRSSCADDSLSTRNRFKTSDELRNDEFSTNGESAYEGLSIEDEFCTLGNLSSEVSAIYHAMQNSKLECIDEQSQESISHDGCGEPDETDEFDDFDPYAFIKNLPELSTVVPRYRRMLLPKQTRSCPSMTLVLDLDETLVHSSLEPCAFADFTFPVNFNQTEHTIYVCCRPFLKDFLERVASLFETIIFTASQSIYAEKLLNILDPRRKLFRHRVYRESCVFVEGNYVKDLSVLGRDLARVIIVDNSPQAFGFQIDNGVPIESWFDDPNDRELSSLLPFLESLVGKEDVRPLIARKFNLRKKVAASSLTLSFSL